ncbi:MAG: hypothetical protein IPN76_19970 [Saprospiraceae bacterium]|nr:hypothetical protein [Saprospiraceae bacterium]
MNHKHISPILMLHFLLLIGNYSFGQTGVSLKPKVYLQGALHGLLPTATLMRDDLRSKGLIPHTEPYTGLPNFQHKGWGGGETIADPTVLEATGPDAIVDWVVVGIHTSKSASSLVATRSALLQRDGDVVKTDGVSPLVFSNIGPGEYYVSVAHRNHLSTMTAGKVALSEVPIFIDLTSQNTYGCMVKVGNKTAMRGGDCSRDGRLIFQGPANDRSALLMRLLNSNNFPGNTYLSANFIGNGYSVLDLNMDGKAIFQGPGNDTALIFQMVMTGQVDYFVPPIQNFILTDCIPD